MSAAFPGFSQRCGPPCARAATRLRRLAAPLGAVALWALVAGLVSGCAQAPEPPPEPIRVKLLAFNDFHGHLLPPAPFIAAADRPPIPAGGAETLAGYIQALRRSASHSVVVSAGDLTGASPLISALSADEGTIEVMNSIGLDFNAVGNHEFDQGKDELLRKQYGGCQSAAPGRCQGVVSGAPGTFGGAQFQYLAANVIDQASGETLFPAYGLRQFDGARVAFIGMTLAGTPGIVRPQGVRGLRFEDEADTVNRLVPSLRQMGVESIIVLIHQGGYQSTEPPAPRIPDINGCAGGLTLSARGGPGIREIVSRLDDAVDLVISGHTHAAYNCQLPNRTGRLIPVTSADAYGRLLTEIDLAIDPATRDVISVRALNRVLARNDPGYPPDAEAGRIVQTYADRVRPMGARVIGRLDADLGTRKNRACEMPAGRLIADAQLEATRGTDSGRAQAALVNPGSVRAPGFLAVNPAAPEKTPGTLTYGEAAAAQPFGNALVTLSLTGAQLRGVLEQQFAGCALPGEPAQPVTRVLQPSANLRFSWDLNAPACRKITDLALADAGRITTIVDQGRLLEPERSYRVTVNAFLADGGDGFTLLRQGRDPRTGPGDLEALVGYFAQHPDAAALEAASGPQAARIRRLDSASTQCP